MKDFWQLMGILIFVAAVIFLFSGNPDVMDSLIEWAIRELQPDIVL